MEILPPEIEQMVCDCIFCHYLFCHYLFLSLYFWSLPIDVVDCLIFIFIVYVRQVQKKLDERNSSADFLSIVGMITYDKPAESAAA